MIPKEFRTINGYVIYVHQSPSGKVYIGKTKQKPIDRWGYNGINYFYNRNTKFANAIRKYGWDNFKHYIIAKNLTITQANWIEKSLIHYHRDVLNNCYNLADGGEGNGHSPTKEMREKLRKINTGKVLSDLTKSKISSANGKSIKVYLPDSTIIEFPSIRKAAKFADLPFTSLSKLLRDSDSIMVNDLRIEVNNDN